MSDKLRPMLSAKVEDLTQLKFPLLGSPKIDGLRAVVRDNQFLSRTLKRVPNLELQDRCEGMPQGLDGELCIGAAAGPDVFRRTTSACMSYDGDITNVQYLVFDLWNMPGTTYMQRYAELNRLKDRLPRWVHIVPQLHLDNIDELESFEKKCLSTGYEGVMLRSMDGWYKFGRSTFREGLLIKLKRFADAEATVVGVEPLFANANPKELNELGYSKRSSHQDGLVEQPMLGALVVEHTALVGEGPGMPGVVRFNIGSGFTEQERYDFWERRDNLIGQKIKYKYLPYGMKDKPRHPIFLGLRLD